MAELIMTGRVLAMTQTPKGWFRLILAGRARYNDVLLLSPEQAVAAGAKVGEVVSLPVGPAVERDEQGHATLAIVYFGRDADRGPSAAALVAAEKGPKAAA